jgi:hypothetical protein
MKRVVLAVSVLFTTMAPTILSAKGSTLKITVDGGDLRRPIAVTENVGKFQVWSGAGTSVNGVGGTSGFIVDWQAGIVERPLSRREYKVSFYTGCEGQACVGSKEQPALTYVVRYCYDPATQEGFVYLPGEHDEFGPSNMSAIYRGYEGHWLHATKTWDNFIQPLIAAGANPGR